MMALDGKCYRCQLVIRTYGLMTALPQCLRRSELVEAIEDELTYWPGVAHDYELRPGGHWQCNLNYRERRRFVVFAATPSDVRAGKNLPGDIRRELIRLGAVRETPKPRPAPETKPFSRPPPPRAIKPPANMQGDPRPDGFEPLRQLLIAHIRELTLRWAHLEVPPERLEEGAQALIASWHPDIIKRAAEWLAKVEAKR